MDLCTVRRVISCPPIGGFIWGHIGDRSDVVMPSLVDSDYDRFHGMYRLAARCTQIGVWAPALLLFRVRRASAPRVNTREPQLSGESPGKVGSMLPWFLDQRQPVCYSVRLWPHY